MKIHLISFLFTPRRRTYCLGSNKKFPQWDQILNSFRTIIDESNKKQKVFIKLLSVYIEQKLFRSNLVKLRTRIDGDGKIHDYGRNWIINQACIDRHWFFTLSFIIISRGLKKLMDENMRPSEALSCFIVKEMKDIC